MTKRQADDLRAALTAQKVVLRDNMNAHMVRVQSEKDGFLALNFPRCDAIARLSEKHGQYVENLQKYISLVSNIIRADQLYGFTRDYDSYCAKMDAQLTKLMQYAQTSLPTPPEDACEFIRSGATEARQIVLRDTVAAQPITFTRHLKKDPDVSGAQPALEPQKTMADIQHG